MDNNVHKAYFQCGLLGNIKQQTSMNMWMDERMRDEWIKKSMSGWTNK